MNTFVIPPPGRRYTLQPQTGEDVAVPLRRLRDASRMCERSRPLIPHDPGRALRDILRRRFGSSACATSVSTPRACHVRPITEHHTVREAADISVNESLRATASLTRSFACTVLDRDRLLRFGVRRQACRPDGRTRQHGGARRTGLRQRSHRNWATPLSLCRIRHAGRNAQPQPRSTPYCEDVDAVVAGRRRATHRPANPPDLRHWRPVRPIPTRLDQRWTVLTRVEAVSPRHATAAWPSGPSRTSAADPLTWRHVVCVLRHRRR